MLPCPDFGECYSQAETENTNINLRHREKLIYSTATDNQENYLDKYLYDGPRNLDSVLSYTWEQKRGGPSGKFKEEAHTGV